MARLHARPIAEWPADLRRTYDQNIALGDFWIAMEEHPLIKRVAMLRNYCGLRWTAAYARAALAEMDARRLLAERDRGRRQTGG